jgi:hypothetical protein
VPDQQSDRYLSPIWIQVFGVVIVAVILAAGVFAKGDKTILLAVLGVAGGFVMLGGFYEKSRYELGKALHQDPAADTRPPSEL